MHPYVRHDRCHIGNCCSNRSDMHGHEYDCKFQNRALQLFIAFIYCPHSFIALPHSFIHPFMHSFTHSSIALPHSFIHPFMHSFTHSSIALPHSFILVLVLARPCPGRWTCLACGLTPSGTTSTAACWPPPRPARPPGWGSAPKRRPPLWRRYGF